MRFILLVAVGLSICGASRPAAAQLYSPALATPLSAYEYHDGTYTTAGGASRAARVKLMTVSDRTTGQRYMTLVRQGADGAIVRPDSVIGFAFGDRRFVQIGQLTADRRLRGALETDFVEIVLDTIGPIELYGYYPRRGNRYVLSPITPGMIHEDDLVRAFIWRRRGAPSFEIMPPLPPRGYSREFENQLRTLFADRPDLVAHLDAHRIRRQDLPAVVKAYNTGAPLRFE